MKLKFVKDCELEIVDNEADGFSEPILETFKAGQVVDADSFEESEEYWSLQFGDGDIISCIPKALTEVLED